MSIVFNQPTVSTSTSLRWVIVAPWENALVVKDGVIVTVASPGRYRRKRRTIWYPVDIRPRILTLPAQEVLTADGVQVRLSVVATVAIVDPRLWLTASASPFEVLYTGIQIALRDRVAALDLGALSAQRATLLEGTEQSLAEAAAAIGATVSDVAVKDITLPAEVRQAIAEAALTKQRGLAELERARSEAAALRSLLNTAKLIADNPALLQLRTLQAAADGAQIIIHRDEISRAD